jgi:hypothetical protein
VTIHRQSTFLPDERMIDSWCGKHLHFEDAIVARSERVRDAQDSVMRTVRGLPRMPVCLLKQPRRPPQPQPQLHALAPVVFATEQTPPLPARILAGWTD